jgi:hypothetical protein
MSLSAGHGYSLSKRVCFVINTTAAFDVFLQRRCDRGHSGCRSHINPEKSSADRLVARNALVQFVKNDAPIQRGVAVNAKVEDGMEWGQTRDMRSAANGAVVMESS